MALLFSFSYCFQRISFRVIKTKRICGNELIPLVLERSSNNDLFFSVHLSSSRSSRSYSPMPKKRKHHNASPSYGSKKDRYSSDRRVKDKSRKRKHRSRSHSYSQSPSPDHKSSHKKRSKEKDRDYRDKDRNCLPDKHSRKHRNGHHPSPSRDRFDRYDSKYDKYRR